MFSFIVKRMRSPESAPIGKCLKSSNVLFGLLSEKFDKYSMVFSRNPLAELLNKTILKNSLSVFLFSF